MKIYSAQLKYTRRQLIAPCEPFNDKLSYSYFRVWHFPGKVSNIYRIISNSKRVRTAKNRSEFNRAWLTQLTSNYHWENSSSHTKSNETHRWPGSVEEDFQGSLLRVQPSNKGKFAMGMSLIFCPWYRAFHVFLFFFFAPRYVKRLDTACWLWPPNGLT